MIADWTDLATPVGGGRRSGAPRGGAWRWFAGAQRNGGSKAQEPKERAREGTEWPCERDARHRGDRGRPEAAVHAAERLGAVALLR